MGQSHEPVTQLSALCRRMRRVWQQHFGPLAHYDQDKILTSIVILFLAAMCNHSLLSAEASNKSTSGLQLATTLQKAFSIGFIAGLVRRHVVDKATKTCMWLCLAMITINEFVLQFREPAFAATHSDAPRLGLSDICICFAITTVVAKLAECYLQLERQEASTVEGQALINRLCSDVFLDEEEFGPAMVLIKRKDNDNIVLRHNRKFLKQLAWTHPDGLQDGAGDCRLMFAGLSKCAVVALSNGMAQAQKSD